LENDINDRDASISSSCECEEHTENTGGNCLHHDGVRTDQSDSVNSTTYEMLIANKKQNEVFGINFATCKEANPWTSIYEVITKDECFFMKFSRKFLQRILDRIYNKNTIKELRFLK